MSSGPGSPWLTFWHMLNDERRKWSLAEFFPQIAHYLDFFSVNSMHFGPNDSQDTGDHCRVPPRVGSSESES